MTRTEAIDLLDNLIGMVDDNHDSDYDTALKMGIQALEYDDAKYHEEHGEVVVDKAVWEDAKKALEQEPCGDLISRQDAYKCLEIHGDYNTLNEVYERLEKLPSVNPQPTGHWIDNHNNTISCDHCHTWFKKDDRYGYMHYCPYCNTKMVEPQESEVNNG